MIPARGAGARDAAAAGYPPAKAWVNITIGQRKRGGGEQIHHACRAHDPTDELSAAASRPFDAVGEFLVSLGNI